MTADICIYGGTSAGVIAAIASAHAGHSVVLVEPGRHLGGMTSGGLGFTDFGNKAAIGGLSREFYRRIGSHYFRKSVSPRLAEERFSSSDGKKRFSSSRGETKSEAWVFEPHVAESVFNDWLQQERVKVLLEHRLSELEVRDGGIERILLEHVPADSANAPGSIENLREHVPLEASIYIDASYEGDLMARARVSFTVGRESSSQYGESLNGVRAVTPKHQFLVPVDPYVKAGDPASGLLPLIQPGNGGIPGSADKRVQAYNFRLCLTRRAENRIPIQPPTKYDPRNFDLLTRYLDALVASGKRPALDMLIKIDSLHNDKTDINNNGAISTDLIGGSWQWPAADYDQRRQVWHNHLHYTQGLLYFLATDPCVPEQIQIRQWGLCRDEFADTGGWPHQLYVREARRMVSSFVITQAVCEHKTTVDDSIGLASYNMDSHNCQRIVQHGVARNEGDVQAPPAGPYPISYRAIVPRADQCRNLLVPVCLSASHIAYGSVRMEPVFMVLGHSAATAASLALQQRINVQDVNVRRLQQRLADTRQVLA